MTYRLVAFDFDGTLADSFPFFLSTLGTLADQYRFKRVEAHEVDTLRGWDARRILVHVGLPLWKVPRVGVTFKALMAANAGNIPLFDGVRDMLGHLAQQGIALAVVTSNSTENVRHILGDETAALVHHYACGATLHGKQQKLQRLLHDTGIPPHLALYVGDEVRDATAARAAGMAFGAVSWGYTKPEALAAEQPQALFATMDDIVVLCCSGQKQTAHGAGA